MTQKNIQKRKFFIPEVVQTSAMDCGPATLKCLLEGYYIPVSYGRLREACQTDVDGTSIDTMEEVANQLGLNAEQVMLPIDTLFVKKDLNLPAIVVVRNPDGINHFIVLWQKKGNFLQIMDPADGRRWVRVDAFLKQIYKHAQEVPAADWRDWAGSEEFIFTLKMRLKGFGFSKKQIQKFIDDALDDATWRSLATLDASIRFLTSLQQHGGLTKSKQLLSLCEQFFAKARPSESDTYAIIPEHYWAVKKQTTQEGDDRLLYTGAVLVRIMGRSESVTTSEGLSSELVQALKEKPQESFKEFWHLLKQDGLFAPLLLFGAAMVSAFSLIIEILLFRALMDIGRSLGLTEQRLVLMIAVLVFLLVIFFLEVFASSGFFRLGRKLELRLRISYLLKIPKLNYRYFNSRLVSDMAERCHSIRLLRSIPPLGKRFVFVSCELIFVTLGLLWLYPRGMVLIISMALVSFFVPLFLQPMLTERDLKARNQASALRRFYLDALIGLVPIRTHAASTTVRREHENLLLNWIQTKLSLEKVSIMMAAVPLLLCYFLVAVLIIAYLSQAQSGTGALLMVYWALNIPVLGQEVAMLTKMYPAYRNVMLRLFELLNIPDEHAQTAIFDQKETKSENKEDLAKGYSLVFQNATVKATGHTLLDDINLKVPAGEDVAIIGSSGAGKSSLVGLLLGWHQPSQGQVLIDDQKLDTIVLEKLRDHTAWIDPSIQLWNRTFLENLFYGNTEANQALLDQIIQDAKLKDLLKAMPDGLQTNLGEGGALVSGGEGQRVRLARAMFRPDARLVVLDEPFRGLDRSMRTELLTKVRAYWQKATLICITHDIKETQNFDRVVIMAHGRIIEEGVPAQLLKDTASHYSRMLKSEEKIIKDLWSNNIWRKIRIADGKVHS
ncbi:ATP-binding cassette domain-containing protein [bacterium]|nr:ATP-binding cassette domain-containing protein [bacterium]